MAKNLKLFFVLAFAFTGISIAWSSLAARFLGVGVNFVAMAVIFAVVLLSFCSDKVLRTRVKDMFIAATVLLALEFIVFVVTGLFDFELSIGAIKAFRIIQNVISVLALLFFAYITFRMIAEAKGAKIHFVELMLGTEKKEKKVKKAKELSNGTLLEKPKHKTAEEEETSNYSTVMQTEQTVVPVKPKISETEQIQKNDEHSEN